MRENLFNFIYIHVFNLITIFFHFFISIAGKPATTDFDLIDLVTPLFAAIIESRPILRWPARPTWPPIVVFSSMDTLPEIPVWAAIVVFFYNNIVSYMN